MKKSIAWSLLLLLATSSFAPVFAWGNDGHKVVGKIASLRVSAQTARRLASILKPGETLASVSTWADTVKERIGQPDSDPDTNAFLQDLQHNEKNREWHYDDLPLGCRSYQTCTGFTPQNDIVHLINICIRTLQGHPDPNQPLSERNALRLLVHFLGDIHQPLHVGSGYIDKRGNQIQLARDPLLIKRNNLPSDRGGNQLIIDNDRKNLHTFWDFTLVEAIMHATRRDNPEDLGVFLKRSISPESNWRARGPLTTWAAQWATDALNQSRTHVYRSVQIKGQRTITVLRDGQPLIRNGRPVTDTVYDITRPANYNLVTRAVARRQLAKAGFRLAQILDAIYSK